MAGHLRTLLLIACQGVCFAYFFHGTAFPVSNGLKGCLNPIRSWTGTEHQLQNLCLRKQECRLQPQAQITMSDGILPTLQRVRNIRDLASVTGTATKEDEGVILQNIKTLVDLRSEKELSTDKTKYNSTLFDEYNSMFYDVKYSKSGRPKAVVPKAAGEDFQRSRHMLSVIDENIYKRGVFKKLGLRKKLKAAVYLSLSYTKARKLFIDFINAAGLPLLNELILDYGGPSIKAVLDVLSDRANHPVAFYCTAGKDRTGLVAMLVLSSLGVEDEAIINDYVLSDSVYKELDDRSAAVGALQQEQLDPERFLGAPRAVMEATMRLVREEYGGVTAYLDRIGFDETARARLRQALCDD